MELSSTDDDEADRGEEAAEQAPQAEQGDGLASNSMASTNSSVSVLPPVTAPSSAAEPAHRWGLGTWCLLHTCC